MQVIVSKYTSISMEIGKLRGIGSSLRISWWTLMGLLKTIQNQNILNMKPSEFVDGADVEYWEGW